MGSAPEDAFANMLLLAKRCVKDYRETKKMHLRGRLCRTCIQVKVYTFFHCEISFRWHERFNLLPADAGLSVALDMESV